MKDYLTTLTHQYPELQALVPAIRMALRLMSDCVRAGGKIMTCGNGGSAADAEHIVGELMKSFLLPRPLPKSLQSKLIKADPVNGRAMASSLQQGIAAISLVSGVSLPTAFANDVNPEYCFAQQVLGLGRPGDVILGISTSGNSTNVNHALTVGRAMGLKTIGLSGRNGGSMAALCDVEIRIPAEETPRIQELHLPVYHALCAELELDFFG